jgi:hypothetical protein
MIDQPKKEEVSKPKTEAELAQEFINEYQALCEKHQMRLVITPAYISRDDGTFSTVLQQSVGKMPKQS